MTEKEKMLAGQLYDCDDAELMELWNHGKKRIQKYNCLDYSNKTEQLKILMPYMKILCKKPCL